MVTSNRIGQNCQIADSAILRKDCVIGNGVVIEDFAVIEERVTIGNGCTICSGAKVGTKPFVGDEHEDKQRFKNKAFRLIIGDNVFVGNNSVIQKGVGRDAIIGEGTHVNNLCNLGHDLIIGKNCKIGLSSSISGYTEIGDDVYIAPGVTINNRIKIGKSCFVGIGSLVLSDVPDFTKVIGRPAKNINAKRKKTDIGKYLQDSPLLRATKARLKEFAFVRRIHNSLSRSRK